MNTRSMTASVVLALATMAISSPAAHAQWYVTPRGAVGYTAGVYAAGAYGGYGAQTPESAYANGMANLVRSAGAYNESSARAAANYQAARSQYIDNQIKISQALAERKKEHKEQVIKELESERAARARRQEFDEAHRPHPLNSVQLNPATGAIEWPAALKTSDFDELRAATQVLFETKAKNGASSELSLQITKNIGEMKDLLRGKILAIPLPEYSEARRFLESMHASAR